MIAFEFYVIEFELERFELMFDAIVDDARKYSPKARKFETKGDTQFEQLDVITIVQVKTKRQQFMHAASFNVQT